MRAMLVAPVALAVVALVVWWRARAARGRSLDRLHAFGADLTEDRVADGESELPDGRIERWLFLAGERRPGAAARFWLRTGLAAAGGLAIAMVFVWLDVMATARSGLEVLPGRVGMTFAPIVDAAPILLVVVAAALPTVRVRRRRRRFVRAVQADLLPVLELFASLAQAGLAFDPTLSRILSTLGKQRPLGRELQMLQVEVMSGEPRSRCMRRFAARIGVPSVTHFTTAVIRANEVGSGLAGALRRLSSELRGELRERALARAQSLPARLVFPLVICFLPGVFVMSLGPAFFAFLTDTAAFGMPR